MAKIKARLTMTLVVSRKERDVITAGLTQVLYGNPPVTLNAQERIVAANLQDQFLAMDQLQAELNDRIKAQAGFRLNDAKPPEPATYPAYTSSKG